MTSPIEKQHPSMAVAQARAAAAAQDALTEPCGLLNPAGFQCDFLAGHPGRCVPGVSDENVTEPPASDPYAGSASAASVVAEPAQAPEPAAPPPGPRQYGLKRRKEHDVETPSGGYIRVRQLSTSQVIELGVLNMKDAFGADLLEVFQGADAESMDAVIDEAEKWASDPERSGAMIEILDRIAVASVIRPKVVAVGETTDDQTNVSDIELVDKWVIFDAALPDEMKAAAQGAQLQALKSVRGQ